MIHIVLPYLPPSTNQAYSNKRGGGRILSKAGKEFKNTVKLHIARYHGASLSFLKPNITIGSFVAFGIPDLYNAGFPKRTDARYKKIDLSNRVKLLEDALVESMEMDDSQIFFSTHYKYLSELPETRLWLWDEEDKRHGSSLIALFSKFAGGTQSV